jgi:hypothetical protein
LWSSTLVVVDFFVTDLIPAAAAHPDPGSESPRVSWRLFG